MNVAVIMGRLTKDPDVRQSQGENPIVVARYSLAVDRRKSANNPNPGTDYISCVVFGKGAEFAEKYLKKGTKICIRGHIQTGSYTNKDGAKVYTTDVVVDEQDFAESKKAAESDHTQEPVPGGVEGFMNIPDGIEEELPFH